MSSTTSVRSTKLHCHATGSQKGSQFRTGVKPHWHPTNHRLPVYKEVAAVAVWRHVQSLGLARAYKEQQAVHSYIRQLLSLHLLPAQHIPETFNHLRGRANTPQLRNLMDYIWTDIGFTIESLGSRTGQCFGGQCAPTTMLKAGTTD